MEDKKNGAEEVVKVVAQNNLDRFWTVQAGRL